MFLVFFESVCTFLLKNSLKNEIFTKSKHLIDTTWQENLDIWLNNNPPKYQTHIAVSYLAKKIKTSKNLGNFQEIKKYIRNIWILFKAMEKVYHSLVFLVLAVKHLIATSFRCCCFFLKASSIRLSYLSEQSRSAVADHAVQINHVINCQNATVLCAIQGHTISKKQFGLGREHLI